MGYLRTLIYTIVYRAKNLVYRALRETQPWILVCEFYTKKLKYRNFWVFFWSERVEPFIKKLRDRKNFSGVYGGDDLDYFYLRIRVRVYQSGFQVALFLFYYWISQILPAQVVNFLALILVTCIIMQLMANKPGWIVYVFHMIFYILVLKQLIRYLNFHEAATLIYLYNLFLRGLVESCLELLIQPLAKFKIFKAVWFIYDEIINKIFNRIRTFFLKYFHKN